jgi:hypothetical protein
VVIENTKACTVFFEKCSYYMHSDVNCKFSELKQSLAILLSIKLDVK